MYIIIIFMIVVATVYTYIATTNTSLQFCKLVLIAAVASIQTPAVHGTEHVCLNEYLDKWRPSQVKRSSAFHNDSFVTHDRDIGTSCSTWSTHHGHLVDITY